MTVTARIEPAFRGGDEHTRRAAAGASAERPFGARGRPLSHRTPFHLGFTAALGVAVAAWLVDGVVRTWGVLVLVVLSGFIAIGLDPVVRALADRGWRRGWAVAVVLFGMLTVMVALVAAAVPVIGTEYRHLSAELPRLLHRLQDRHDAIGDAAQHLHVSSRSVENVVSFRGVVSVGRTLLSAVVTIVTVVVLSCYLLVNLPAIKRTAYRLVPRSRRARVTLLTDEILRLIGGYLLGNLITSAMAGVAMTAWLLATGVPGAFFLGLLVAIFDLIPMIGAPLAGLIVALVALTQSLPLALATVGFTIAFRVLEDYVISPRVMRHTVEVAPVLTVVGVLLGAALLGLIGALLAVPVVAAVDLLRREVAQPRLDAA